MTTDYHHWIVVDDPNGEFWEGALIDSIRNKQLEGRKAATLPVEPELMKTTGVGGFMKRAWGAGWPFDGFVPKRACPLTLFCTHGHAIVHWRGRIVADPKIIKAAAAGEHHEGQLRLVSDSGQFTPHHASLSLLDPPVNIRELGAADKRGGWLVGGRGQINVSGDGHYGMSLYGTAPGFRVAWAAVSITKR